MEGELQREETPIDAEIVREVISLTPSHWKSAFLEVRYSLIGTETKYSHMISSPEGYKEAICPSAELFDATFRLGSLFKKYGQHWKVVRYSITQDQMGAWKYVAEFEYA